MHWTEPFHIEFWIPVFVAILCGVILGLERQLRGKPAGIRTSVLICLGTVTYIRLGMLLDEQSDPTRVLSQVVTGVGFLGGGVILSKDGLVNGVTSAAIIWLLAAIGCAIGLNHFGAAIAISIVSVCVLIGVEWLERGSRVLRRGVHSHTAHVHHHHHHHPHHQSEK
jgi:putative Mg2+ transporter-C (MgtC) family protein